MTSMLAARTTTVVTPPVPSVETYVYPPNRAPQIRNEQTISNAPTTPA